MRLPSFPRSLPFALSLLVLCVTVLVYARQLHSQQQKAADAAIQTTTQERVESEPWWPTKTTFPLSSYTGSAACTRCHTDEASDSSSMQRAAAPVADSRFLAGGHHQSVTLPPYTYTLAGDELSVSHGDAASTNKIAWDLGAGDLAHTFLFQHDSHWFQSQVTWYTHTSTLDTTTGFNTAGDADIQTALGQKLTGEEARKCFACHTVHATSSSGFNPALAEPGLGCEGCHGPGKQHVEQASAQAALPKPYHPGAGSFRSAIFNPAALSPGDAIEFCGACHRTPMDATLAAGPKSLGTAMVRFQPYRLEQSKCWRATQSERLTCTACHNPHEPLERAASTYDKTCLGCHSVIHGASAPQHVTQVASAGKTSCVSCHMPKVEVSSMHGAFTDHRIRIAQAGEAFPE